MGSSPLAADIHASVPLIAPSLLACDFGQLAREVQRLGEAGAQVLHLDVMDGHFVPNISFGIPIVEAIRRATDLALDVHLMISEPDRYVEAFRKAGADMLTFHIEVEPEPADLLRKVRRLGAAAGLSLNPSTPTDALRPYLTECDLVLVMSVMPGFGGQKFQPVALDKLRRLREAAGPDLLLSIDGGVDADTIVACAGAGADVFVMGTAFFRRQDYRQHLEALTHLARSGKNGRV
ncbi:MAG: ribulose-phosphate 3-epimerase [Pirellulales bacterium]|nr:ribulose-phosphate 3-epimerase [Pirellulales bacterium]